MESVIHLLAWRGWTALFTIAFCLAVIVAYTLYSTERRRAASERWHRLLAIRYSYVDPLNFVIERCWKRQRDRALLLRAFAPPQALGRWTQDRAALGADSIALSHLHERIVSYNRLVKSPLQPKFRRRREAEARKRIDEIKKSALRLKTKFDRRKKRKGGSKTATAKPAAKPVAKK